MSLNSGPELLTVEEMVRADALAVDGGVSSLDLMEAAGASVVRELRKRWIRRPVVVLAGPGNNGGDGFVVARLLSQLGWPVRLGLLGNQSRLHGDARVNSDRWEGQIEKLSTNLLENAELVVDAIFGAGLSRSLDGVVRDVVEAIHVQKLPCVSVDIPSGIHGNTGVIMGSAPNAELTVTFFRKKPGHVLLPGREYCGETVVTDIGIPREVLTLISPATVENMPEIWVDKLPTCKPDDHKYTRGHAIVIGGDEMTGAAKLAARAARRVGAGMLSIVATDNAKLIYQNSDPGNVVLELSEDRDLSSILRDERRNAVLVGPGNGVTQITRNNAITALKSKKSVVLDADALTIFETDPQALFAWINGPCVLTPHQGEFGRLFEIDLDKLANCRRASAIAGSVVLLKGFDTVIADANGRAAINSNAPTDLATAGAGDVLSGLILGLLAQGMAPFAAACAGAWLHGEAAKSAGVGLIAEDLVENLPNLLAELRKQTKSVQ